ncbi:MAG: type transport system permease protein [Actinomycetota bacterium]|nr:type transport system permease protein [Actinomycetota bacterium]
MTTATLATPTSSNGGRVTQARVIESEWIKLRSLRSTLWSFVAAAVFIIGLGVLFTSFRANTLNSGQIVGDFSFDATQVSLRGIFLAQLAIGVLGVMAVTGEYSTGMIRATLSAVPRRLPVLWAKLAVFAGVVFVLMLASTFIAFELGQSILSSTHHQASLSSPGALRAIVGGALYLAILAMLGVGLGFLVRNTGGAIASLFGLLLILPVLAQALPGHWAGDVWKYLPMPAGTSITGTLQDPSLLSPWTGLGVFSLYAVAAVGAGAVMLKRRDA